ncbi:hypothetical protein [Rhodopseudomonas palustris]|uniref:hypothetical protein n=1 Tax=Rhodopseudomonas palustris TaxID=1076 RepID=UPI0010576092|nr:hypothetical protein [Rhodopseudomonas palustris]
MRDAASSDSLGGLRRAAQAGAEVVRSQQTERIHKIFILLAYFHWLTVFVAQEMAQLVAHVEPVRAANWSTLFPLNDVSTELKNASGRDLKTTHAAQAG